MRGLFVVGTGPGARERGVAGGIESAANDAGASNTRSAPFAFAEPGPPAVAARPARAGVGANRRPAPSGSGGRAPPAIAARHAGAELDADELVESVRAAAAETPGDALVVAASSGGLLAPLTERYSNRDLAHEVGLPLV